MVRAARIVVPGAAHHVTQRGNDRQTIFFDDTDRLRYLLYLRESFLLYGVRLTAYCLMTNHVHLVAVPETERALASAVGRTHLLYAQYKLQQQRRSGHFWQGRFYSCPLDELHSYNVAAYVELNPVRAGMAATPWAYLWSSAPAHYRKGADVSELLDLPAWFAAMPVATWRETLQVIQEAKALVDIIRMHTRLGRPLGNAAFLQKLETLQYPVGTPSRGRPRKSRNDSSCS